MTNQLFIAAAVAAAALAALGLTGHRSLARQRDALEALRTELGALRDAPASPAPSSSADDLARVAASVDALHRRIARLETSSERRAVKTEAPAEVAEVARVEPAPEETPADDLDGLRELLDELRASNWDYSGPALQRFLEQFKDGVALDRLIGELEAEVDANPGDVEGRMDLADAYVGKLMTLSGPEQGVWGGKAERQWKEVVALDDDHWRAHSSLGTNYSFYPSVMGKTGDAIHHLERARELQRHTVAEPRHVQTYLYLSRLYGRRGDAEQAAEVLREGLELHPGDSSLTAALGALSEG